MMVQSCESARRCCLVYQIVGWHLPRSGKQYFFCCLQMIIIDYYFSQKCFQHWWRPRLFSFHLFWHWVFWYSVSTQYVTIGSTQNLLNCVFLLFVCFFLLSVFSSQTLKSFSIVHHLVKLLFWLFWQKNKNNEKKNTSPTAMSQIFQLVFLSSVWLLPPMT